MGCVFLLGDFLIIELMVIWVICWLIFGHSEVSWKSWNRILPLWIEGFVVLFILSSFRRVGLF